MQFITTCIILQYYNNGKWLGFTSVRSPIPFACSQQKHTQRKGAVSFLFFYFSVHITTRIIDCLNRLPFSVCRPGCVSHDNEV